MGFNQALLLARHFFPTRKKDIKADWLVRHKKTIPQTELTGSERRKNLRNSFSIGRGTQQLAGSVVCLVDDVFTTGTTGSECSTVLKKYGVKEVKMLTLARVKVPGRGRSG